MSRASGWSALRSGSTALGADALLVTDLVNIRYLTGLHGLERAR